MTVDYIINSPAVLIYCSMDILVLLIDERLPGRLFQYQIYPLVMFLVI